MAATVIFTAVLCLKYVVYPIKNADYYITNIQIFMNNFFS